MGESLQRRLDEQRERSAAKRPAEVGAAISRTIESLRAAGLADRALRPGDRAPAFELPDARGREIASGDLLARGPLVLAFYRGAW